VSHLWVVRERIVAGAEIKPVKIFTDFSIGGVVV
jgi:hypothetical protein